MDSNSDESTRSASQSGGEPDERSSALRQLVFATIAEGVVLMDADGLIVDWNPAAERIFGYSREEMIGKKPDVYRDPEIAAALEVQIGAALERDGRWSGEVRFVRKDGTEGVSEATVSVQYDATGKRVGLVGVHRDITRRKRAEEVLRQTEERLLESQKMEAIGRMAGGIAHDFNNLLTTIKGNVELALVELPAGSPLQADLVEVRKAADSAASLTRQLLSFTTSPALDPRRLDLNAAIENTTGMLRRIMGGVVEVTLELASDLWPVFADPAKIEQLVLNLCLNSREAMPDGGRIGIRTAKLTLHEDAPDARYSAPPGEYVLLSVRDTGVGMDEDTRERVFDPFFTTKDHGKGTGLGLFTVYAIVKQSGGFMNVDSRPGEGTSFHILFPRSKQAPSEEASKAPSDEAPVEPTQTILLVEDEPSVRMLAHKLLARSGYRVLEAANGADALAVSRAYTGPIDLLLTDVVMPKLSGPGLARELAAERPGLRIVFMSGYIDSIQLPSGAAGGILLQKPFSLDALLKVVRSSLEPASPIRSAFEDDPIVA